MKFVGYYTLLFPYQDTVAWRVPVTGNLTDLRGTMANMCNPKVSNPYFLYSLKFKN